LSKNQAIIHRQNSLHSIKCGGDIHPNVIIIGFECDARIIDRFSLSPITLSDGAIQKLAEIVKEGRNVFKPPYNTPVYDMKKKKHQPYGAEQMLRLSLESFLLLLLREYRDPLGGEDKTEAPTPIQEVIAYVSANFLERMTIDELAFLFKTNRATLCREFKRETGKTLVSFVNEKKIARAKEKIATTSKTFTQIAEEMNFESIHYFTRFFKKMTGVTPKEFRQKNKSQKTEDKQP
jgi:AraC-like DNA-binding protein